MKGWRKSFDYEDALNIYLYKYIQSHAYTYILCNRFLQNAIFSILI